MMNLSNISVVLPSLDPDEKLAAVIDGLLLEGFADIILVNDGSKPENLHYFEEAARHPQVHLLHHSINRGKGAALKTAFDFFLTNRPDGAGVVTVDGDNQHHHADTRACSEHMLQTGRLTLGVRDFDQPDVPFKSRSGNKITSFVFKIFVGMTISDTQTGLRAIPRKDLQILTAIAGDRFEYETNMLLALKEHNIPYDEVKIRTVYIEENKSSHFRAVRDSWRIYKLILAHFFRFAGSSLVSAAVDITLFSVFSALPPGPLSSPQLTFVSTLGARTISSILNFTMNRRLVFRTGVDIRSSVCKYYALAIPQMLAQALLTQGAIQLLNVQFSPLLQSIVYAAVMVILFIFSFIIQQRWVFAPKNKTNEE